MARNVILMDQNGNILTEDYLSATGGEVPGGVRFYDMSRNRLLSESDVAGMNVLRASPAKRGLIDRVSSAFNTLFNRAPSAMMPGDMVASTDRTATQMTPNKYGLNRDPHYHNIGFPGFSGRILESMEVARERKANLQLYEDMMEMDEFVSAAAFIYADYATKGDADEDEGGFKVKIRGSGSINTRENLLEQERSASDPLMRRVAQILRRTQLKQEIYGDSWSLFKCGEAWRELVHMEGVGLVRYKHIRPIQMWMNLDKFGNFRSNEHAYIQLDHRTNSLLTTLAHWQTVHYGLKTDPSNPYGTSLLRPARRLYKKLRLIKDSMVVARLHRAPARYVFVVDVPGGKHMTPEDTLQYAEEMRDRLLKRQTIAQDTGELGIEEHPLSADFDFYVPRTREGGADVKMLAGDQGVGQLADVEFLMNGLFATLSIPRPYFGFGDFAGGGGGSGKTVTQQEVNFMRRVRGIRSALRPGIKKTLQIGILLETGQFVQDEDIDVIFPELGMIDRLRQVQMQQMEAAVATIYKVSLQIPDELIYEKLLTDFTPEDVKKIKAHQEKLKKEQEAMFQQGGNSPGLGRPTSRPQFQTGPNGERQRVPTTVTRGLPGGGRQNGDDGAGERTTAGLIALSNRITEQCLREGRVNIDALFDDLKADPAVSVYIKNLQDLTMMQAEDS